MKWLLLFLLALSAQAAPKLTITSWEQFQHKQVLGQQTYKSGHYKDALGDHWLFVISWDDPGFSYGLMESVDFGKTWFPAGTGTADKQGIFRLEKR